MQIVRTAKPIEENQHNEAIARYNKMTDDEKITIYSPLLHLGRLTVLRLLETATGMPHVVVFAAFKFKFKIVQKWGSRAVTTVSYN